MVKKPPSQPNKFGRDIRDIQADRKKLKRYIKNIEKKFKNDIDPTIHGKYKIYSAQPETIHLWLIDKKINHCIPFFIGTVLVDSTREEKDNIVGCCCIDGTPPIIVFQYIENNIEETVKKWFIETVKEEAEQRSKEK